MKIIPVPNLSDNYTYLITTNKSTDCIVIDMGQAEPVIQAIRELELNPIGLLITHHHWDHSGDTNAFKKTFPHISVYGSERDEMPNCDIGLSGGETLHFPELDLSLNTLKTPGHTRDAICYHNDKAVFTGDTMFSAGCGRLFEGTPEQMFDSLQDIAYLGDTLAVYSGHEYTKNNLAFALSLDPTHQPTLNWLANLKHPCSMPSTIAQEKACNPFLRCADTDYAHLISTLLGRPIEVGPECLAEVRKLKDQF